MKEKTLKFMSKYLLFGVLTCLIGFGAASCGEEYDDTGIKNEMKGLKETLTALQGSAITSTNLDKAVKDATDAAKASIMTEVQKMMTGGSTAYNAEQVAQVLGQLMALSEAFSASPQFAQAVNTLEGVVGEAATKANTPAPWVKAIVDYNTRITALEVQANAVKGYVGTFPAGATLQGDIAKLKAELEAQIATGGSGNVEELAAELAKQDAFIQAIAEKINSTNPDLVSLTGMMNRMITNISIVDISNAANAPTTYVLPFSTGGMVLTPSYTFGANLNGAISFVKDNSSSAAASVVIRVTPAHAVVTKEMFSLIDSREEAGVNNFVQVTDVVPYKEVLTRAGVSQTGLYKVNFNLKSPDTFKESDFNKVVKSGIRNVAFAIAIKGSSSDNRLVLTDFACKLTHKSAGNPVHDLKGQNKALSFMADATLVGSIRNRPNGEYKEKTWKLDISDYTDKAGANAVEEVDDRTSQNTFPVIVNKAFTVKMESAIQDAQAYYIDLDFMNNAYSDEKDMWASAKSSGITGLNKVYAIDETASLMVTNAALKGKEIGLRVFAVNYDGTFVDPDGRAFYITVGTGDPVVVAGELKMETVIDRNMSGGQTISSTSIEVPYLKANPGRVNSIALTTMTGLNNTTIAIAGDVKPLLIKDGKEVSATWETATKIKIAGLNVTKLKDMADITTYYDAVLSLQDASGAELATYTIKLAKKLPAGKLPAGFRLINDVTENITHNSFNPNLKSSASVQDGKLRIIPAISNLTDGTLSEARYGSLQILNSIFTTDAIDNDAPAVDGHVQGVLLSDATFSNKDFMGGVYLESDFATQRPAYTILANNYTSSPLLKVLYNYGPIMSSGADFVTTGILTSVVEVASVCAGHNIMLDTASSNNIGFNATNMTLNVPLLWESTLVDGMVDGGTNGTTVVPTDGHVSFTSLLYSRYVSKIAVSMSYYNSTDTFVPAVALGAKMVSDQLQLSLPISVFNDIRGSKTSNTYATRISFDATVTDQLGKVHVYKIPSIVMTITYGGTGGTNTVTFN